MTVPTTSASICEDSALQQFQPVLSDDFPLPVRNQMLRVIEAAEPYVTELNPSLNFVARLNTLQTTVQWLKRARKKDRTPKLQFVPETDGLTWIEFFQALHQHGQRLHARPDARVEIPAPEGVRPLSEVIPIAEDLWNRLRISVNSNGSRPDVSGEHKSLVFGGRSMPRSRAAWVTELGLEISVIEGMENPPPALLAALPFLRDTEQLMDLAADGRGPPPSTTLYSREIHITSYAIDIALGEFLSWAAIMATTKRLKTFQRIIAPRHRRDGTPVLAADPASKPEEDEIIDDPPSEEEEELDTDKDGGEEASAVESADGEDSAEASTEREDSVDESTARGDSVEEPTAREDPVEERTAGEESNARERSRADAPPQEANARRQ